MLRLALCVCGISAAVAAWAVLADQKISRRLIPVSKAAAMLQEAWADHRTRD